MINSIKKSAAYYVGAAGVLFALVAIIVGSITKCLSWDTWSIYITIALCVGIAAEIANFLFGDKIDVLSLVPVICYSIAFAIVINFGVQVVIDAIRQIDWVHGNSFATIICMVSILIAAVLCTIRAYVEKDRRLQNEKASV